MRVPPQELERLQLSVLVEADWEATPDTAVAAARLSQVARVSILCTPQLLHPQDPSMEYLGNALAANRRSEHPPDRWGARRRRPQQSVPALHNLMP